MPTNKAIASGFKEDCEKLLTKFGETNDVRFQTFSNIWKDMNFSLVFSCRQILPELLEFCEEALQISKQFLLFPTRFKDRIGGLYLLYGIYYKMPTNLFKIRITLEDWQKIKELHLEIKEGEHLDANYILSKLIVDNAFYYCAFEREFGLEKQFRTRNKSCVNPYSVLPATKDLTEPGQILATMNDLIKQYEKKKRAIFSDLRGTSSLNLFNANIVNELIDDITKLGAIEENICPISSEKDPCHRDIQSSSKSIKRRRPLDKIIPKIGHGFVTDFPQSTENEDMMEISGDNADVPEIDVSDSD